MQDPIKPTGFSLRLCKDMPQFLEVKTPGSDEWHRIDNAAVEATQREFDVFHQFLYLMHTVKVAEIEQVGTVMPLPADTGSEAYPEPPPVTDGSVNVIPPGEHDLPEGN